MTEQEKRIRIRALMPSVLNPITPLSVKIETVLELRPLLSEPEYARIAEPLKKEAEAAWRQAQLLEV